MCLAHEVAGRLVRFAKIVGVDSEAEPPPDLCVGDGCLVATCKKPSDLRSVVLRLPTGVSLANTDPEVGSSGRLNNAFQFPSARPDFLPGFATVGCLVKWRGLFRGRSM